MPSGCGVHSPIGSPGGSPRIASTLLMPSAAYEPMTCRSSAIEWFTPVRCATGNRVVSLAIRPVVRTVRSRLEPPAP